MVSVHQVKITRGRMERTTSEHIHTSIRNSRHIIHNRKVKYGALAGWGIVIYSIMSLAWSLFVIYGLAGTLTARLLALLVLIVIATIAGRSLGFHSWRDILPYSIGWGVMMAALDAIFSVPFSGWVLYADWNLWLGYALVVVVPLLAPKTRRSSEVRHT